MKNFDWCAYTFRHRRAIEYLIEKLIQDENLKAEMKKRAELHDMDKILLYQAMEQYTAQLVHVENQRHHLECKKEKTYLDLVETVLDYESAPYTKPDKPLNAFDFVHKLLEMKLIEIETANQLFQIMHTFGIDFSGTVQADEEGRSFIQHMEPVTEDMIMEEIIAYIRKIS